MLTIRSDIQRDSKRIMCKNSSLQGYSSIWLYPGDFFLYKIDDCLPYFARCHGRIRENTSKRWKVLAQVINDTHRFTMERWILPTDIIETSPKDKSDPYLIALFQSLEENQDKYTKSFHSFRGINHER